MSRKRPYPKEITKAMAMRNGFYNKEELEHTSLDKILRLEFRFRSYRATRRLAACPV